jgi:FkbM family methyltransferase
MDKIWEIINHYNRIVLYGAGKNLRGKWTLLSIADYIIDQKVKGPILGKDVFPPSKLLEEDEKTLVVITSDKYWEEIKNNIVSLSPKVAIMLWNEICFLEIEAKTGFNSWSEFGEDIIVEKFLQRFGIIDIFYMDIGIPTPISGSNTYHFYCKGDNGILVEPNPDVTNAIKKERSRDFVECCGIGSRQQNGTCLQFYRCDDIGCSTFSKDVAESRKQIGIQITDVINVPVLSLEAVIEKYGICPDYISMDVEGYEEVILACFPFEKFPVKVWVIEKRDGVKELMDNNGYSLAVETPSNWIFVLKALYEKYYVKWYNYYKKKK